MGDDIREKRKFIIEKSQETAGHLKDSKNRIPDIRGYISGLETKLDEDIHNLEKSVKFWEAIPDKALSKASPELLKQSRKTRLLSPIPTPRNHISHPEKQRTFKLLILGIDLGKIWKIL